MAPARILCQLGLFGAVMTLLAGCAKPSIVDESLAAGGAPATEFSGDNQSVTLTARFSSDLAADASFTVEWLSPDGKIYLRKPVRRSIASPDLVETAMLVHGKAPARYPGLWHVRLWRGEDKLVDRSFEIRKQAQTPKSAAAGFESLAYCGPSRWNDRVISGRHAASAATRVPGAWVGTALLEAVGATYSSMVLLTGCAPS